MAFRHLQLSLSEVIDLHSQGLSNVQIAAQLGCSDATIWRLLRQHKGPEAARNGLRSDACRKRLKRTLHEQGYHCFSACREERHRITAYLAWPGCGPLTRAQRKALDTLAQLESPATAHEIADAAGLSRNYHELHSTLHSLLERGLLACCRRGGGRYSHPLAWSLAGAALLAAQRQKAREDLD